MRKVKNLENLSLDEIESKALSCQNSYLENREQFIFILNYLKTTNRFRENPRYKDSSFADYLSSKFHTTIGTFDSEKRSFLSFPKEVKRWDIGVVRETLNKVSPLKIPSVFAELDQKQAKSNKPLTLPQIKGTIKKYSRPYTVKQINAAEESKSTKETIKRLMLQHERDQATIAEQAKTILSLQGQLERAKKAVAEKNNLVDRYVKPFVKNFENRVAVSP